MTTHLVHQADCACRRSSRFRHRRKRRRLTREALVRSVSRTGSTFTQEVMP